MTAPRHENVRRRQWIHHGREFAGIVQEQDDVLGSWRRCQAAFAGLGTVLAGAVRPVVGIGIALECSTGRGGLAGPASRFKDVSGRTRHACGRAAGR
jgi:hypothetical protein